MYYSKDINYENIVKNYSLEKQYEILCKYKQTGNLKYRDQIFQCYIPVVFHIVYKKFKNYKSLHDDLIQEGMLLLIEFIDKFDLEKSSIADLKGVLFFQIHLNLLRIKNRYKYNVHIPFNVVSNAYKLFKIYNEYFVKHGKYMPIDKLRKNINLTDQSFRTAIKFMNKIYQQQNSFINSNIHTEDMIINDTPYTILENKDDWKYINEVLDNCDHKHIDALKMKINIDGGNVLSYQEVSNRYGKLSRQRLHQAKNQIVKKIKPKLVKEGIL